MWQERWRAVTYPLSGPDALLMAAMFQFEGSAVCGIRPTRARIIGSCVSEVLAFAEEVHTWFHQPRQGEKSGVLIVLPSVIHFSKHWNHVYYSVLWCRRPV
jgi:hypothetical protein